MRNVAPTDKRVRLVGEENAHGVRRVMYENTETLYFAWISREVQDIRQGGWSVYTDWGVYATGLKKSDAVRTVCNLLVGE